MTLRNLNDGNIQLNEKLLHLKSRLFRLAEQVCGPVPLPPTPQQSNLTPPTPTRPDAISGLEANMSANHDAADAIANAINHLEDHLLLNDKSSVAAAR